MCFLCAFFDERPYLALNMLREHAHQGTYGDMSLVRTYSDGSSVRFVLGLLRKVFARLLAALWKSAMLQGISMISRSYVCYQTRHFAAKRVAKKRNWTLILQFGATFYC